MIKLLKTLVVILFLMSAAAFTLGFLLFQKREILMGRTQKLEQALIAVGATIEAVAPSVDEKPDYPARDLSETTASFLPEPERSDFWEHYAAQLEIDADRYLDLAAHRAQLTSYYKIDPITLRPVRDPFSGQKITAGKGTMQALLDDVMDKAEAQLHKLNQTRDQLRGTRDELVDVVTELNTKKQDLRSALRTVVDRDGAIAQLEDEVRAREKNISERDEQIASLDEAMDQLKFQMEERDVEIAYLSNDVARLEAKIAAITVGPGGDVPPRIWPTITPGTKGMVADINEDWNFVVLRLSDEFLRQYSAAMETTKSVPDPDFFIMRHYNGDEAYISKVKLLRVNPQINMGVANILADWQQDDIRKGDEVRFY